MLYSTTVQIDAPRQRVWDILVDGSRWPEWEPNCVRVEGEIALGNKLTVHTKLSDKAFPANVAEMEAPQRMVWSWGMPLGMFKGERTFLLTEKGGGTEVYCGEEFSGWALGLFGKMVPDLSESFEQFGQGLKQVAET